MKKILYALALVAFATTTVNAKEAFYTNNNGIEITQQEYNNLKGLGFTEKQIAKMDSKTFNKKKDINANIVAQNAKHLIKISYLKNGIKKEKYEVVTEKEFNGRLMNPGASLQSVSGNYYNGMVITDIQAVVTTISNINDLFMQYRVDVYNYETPTKRSFDIYGIGIENNKVQVASAIECYQDWIYSNGTHGHNDACYPKTESTGGSAMFELPTGSLTDLETYISFYVAKLPTVGTIHFLEAVGDYAHAISTVTNAVYNHYSVNIGGINVYSPYSTSYDTINTPGSAGFTGTW